MNTDKVWKFLEGKKTIIILVTIAVFNALLSGEVISLEPETIIALNAILAALGVTARIKARV